MPLDPASPLPTTPDARRADKIAALERRVDALERAHPVVQVLSAAPTTTPRGGTLAGDSSTSRLYLFIGGAWRFVTLT